jgi:hypothetical protein
VPYRHLVGGVVTRRHHRCGYRNARVAAADARPAAQAVVGIGSVMRSSRLAMS